MQIKIENVPKLMSFCDNEFEVEVFEQTQCDEIVYNSRMSEDDYQVDETKIQKSQTSSSPNKKMNRELDVPRRLVTKNSMFISCCSFQITSRAFRVPRSQLDCDCDFDDILYNLRFRIIEFRRQQKRR